jgi:tRNA (guanine37-N1)-methyltransferase
MHIHIITLFPKLFEALDYSIPGIAQKRGLLQLSYTNPRAFAQDKHQQVDDRPYGGGPGMVMKVEPLLAAIRQAFETLEIPPLVSYLSPQGTPFNQQAAQVLSQRKQLLLVAGRYEGIDERIYQLAPHEEWSLGDFILSGGELAALCMVDAICRLLPGALGDSDSAKQDSFSQGLLDHPHYTRPEYIEEIPVPEVLKSGHHAKIATWRLQQALGRTWLKRPDLLKNRILSPKEQVLLTEFIAEWSTSHESLY